MTRLWRNQSGASAAEFAMLLPVALLFLIGLLDAGRFFYTINQGEKATQIGARWAVVTDPVAPALATTSYVGATVGGVTLTQGDRIPAEALGRLTCTQTICECNPGPCPTTGTPPGPSFATVVARMQDIMPQIGADNVVVEYRGSGLGYAGDPDNMDIAPLVTVRAAELTFSPYILLGFTMNLPDFSYTLTMEDGKGQEAF
ncbi:pilus assembly protein [Caenibius tardaugens NBRC 16725]|nr:pilus assembly protein [Caenibius tardaugens NBRC 16725]